MDARLIALKLSLEELNIEFDISTIENRVLIQKAVYFGQVAGTDIGYRFNWDQKGPYSGDLASDYHTLANDISLGDKEYENKELQEPRKEDLHRIRSLMHVPDNVKLEQWDWLELLASLHYLKRVTGLSEEDSAQKIKKDKKSLFKYVSEAITQLKNYPSLKYSD
ncbi:MAG: hypothetical protein LUM44_07700 [Pyrinomonadaceae bacterium]|nr:hypothetical protein [Pyrinomonadaceae bacterium]